MKIGWKIKVVKESMLERMCDFCKVTHAEVWIKFETHSENEEHLMKNEQNIIKLWGEVA
jgi:hypothetical protein